MTRLRKTITLRRIGDTTATEETEYMVVSVHEVDQMLLKVKNGGNEQQLRKELIKESKW